MRSIAIAAVGVSIAVGILFVASTLVTGEVFRHVTAYAQQKGDRAVVNESLTVESGEAVDGNASVTNGKLTVLGHVLGDAIVVNGDMDIEGTVDGNIMAGGNLHLGPKAVVRGDVMSLSGAMNREQGAVVTGHLTRLEIPFLNAPNTVNRGLSSKFPLEFSSAFKTGFSRLASFLFWGMGGFVLIAVCGIFALLFPRRLQISERTLGTQTAPSITVGTIVGILLGPLTVGICLLLLATGVGIVFIPFVGIAAIVTLSGGLTVSAAWLGRRVHGGRNSASPSHPAPALLEALLGLGVLLSGTLLPAALLPGPVKLIMFSVLYLAACAGLGSLLLSRVGTLAPPQRFSSSALS